MLQHSKVPNDEKGFRQLLKQTGTAYHFVMKVTGVYHISLMFFLYEHNCRYSVVNVLQIRRYIQMHLERNKSDSKDARRVCEYGIKKITSEITTFANQI